MDFRILGPLEVAENGRTIDIGAAKQQTLLAALLLYPQTVLSVTRLGDELWGEDPPSSAAKAVQGYVSGLRRALGRDAIVTRAGGYSVALGHGELDALRFEQLVSDGEALLRADPDNAARHLRDALGLWRGAALDGLLFGSGAAHAAGRLDERRTAALERRVEADLACGRHRELVAELQELVCIHPYRETLRAHFMLALYRSGRQTEALAAYRDTRRLLAGELGIEPGPQLAALEGQLLGQDAQLDLPARTPLLPTSPQPIARQPRRASHDSRRLMTALAARASTTDPEALHEVLDGCAAIVKRADGRVERCLGNAVVALFGPGESCEDDSRRAARAALELLQASSALRIGIETGELFVRTSQDGDTVTTGDAIAAAARLAELADDGEILLGPRVRVALEASVLIEPARGLLRGLSGLAPAVARAAATPFVGRTRDLAQLHEIFERVCVARACHVVTILGEAGAGKSRLAAELAAELTDRATVLAVACREVAADGACPLLAELVHELGGHPGAGDETPTTLRPLLEQLARERPLVIVVDDLQRAGTEVLDLIDYLVAFSNAAPILLLCLARPELLESRPAWAYPQRGHTQHVLAGLTDAEAGELVTRLGAADRATAIVAVAEGNPLFLKQFVTASRDLPPGALPGSVQAILNASIDRLDAGERDLLRCGAVEGRTFHAGTLAALAAPQDREAIRGQLVALARKGLIRSHRSPLAGEDAFEFDHALLHDTVYREIPKRARAELHAGVAGWLKDRPGATDELVAHHLEQAWRLRADLGAAGGRGQRLASGAARQLTAATPSRCTDARTPAPTAAAPAPAASVPALRVFDGDAGR